MRGNQLTFSRSGNRSGLYGVNPLLFSQYTAINGYFLPDEKEWPQHGLQAQVLVFDFGFSVPAMLVGPMDSQFAPFALSSNFLAYAITGVSDIPPASVVTVPLSGTIANRQVTPSYLLNIQQTHAGNTWQWMNKDITDDEAVGTGQHPLMFKSPAFLPAGDTISCVVRNLGNNSLRVQVTLIGASF